MPRHHRSAVATPPVTRRVHRSPLRMSLACLSRGNRKQILGVAPDARSPDPVSDYPAKRPPAPRSSHPSLDGHGRAVHNSIDEDHLEIPAFLPARSNNLVAGRS